jgi:hypothetical protein
VNCAAVRDRLTERALGGLLVADEPAVDRHLAWCAACRKEASELSRAATTLVFALAPVEPPADLEDRLVDEVHRAVTKGRPIPRRGRLAVALAVAAMVAVSGLGWGAVMAGRAARFAATAETQRQRTADATARFSRLISSSEFNDPGNQVFLGMLAAATRETGAAGSALTLISPGTRDVAIVMVNGFRPSQTRALPLRVYLVSEQGGALRVGRIAALDSGGDAIVVRRFGVDLSGYGWIEVRDRSGAVVLRGHVRPRPSITTPSP